MSTATTLWQDPLPYVAANGRRFDVKAVRTTRELLMYRPRTEREYAENTHVATTVQDLHDAPYGHIAVDRNLNVYTKPFHLANMWHLGGFTEKIEAESIPLPARLYKLTPDGHIVPPGSENS